MTLTGNGVITMVTRGVRVLLVLSCVMGSESSLRALVAQSGTSVMVAAGTQSMTVPWYVAPVTYRFNPAFLVGAETPLKSGESWRMLFGINVGFFRHHWWMTGISLEPEIGFGHMLPGGLYTDVRLGAGYLHYFWRRPQLELDEGRYVSATDWGRPSLIVPISATLGYRGRRDDPLSISPFVSARWGIQGLFHSEVAVATHLFLLGGIRIERQPSSAVGER